MILIRMVGASVFFLAAMQEIAVGVNFRSDGGGDGGGVPVSADFSGDVQCGIADAGGGDSRGGEERSGAVGGVIGLFCDHVAVVFRPVDYLCQFTDSADAGAAS